MDELNDFLKAKGHQCVKIYGGGKKYKFVWCQEDECIVTRNRKLMREQTSKVYAFAQTLRQQGHNCISYLECRPPKVRYCGQSPCVKNLPA